MILSVCYFYRFDDAICFTILYVTTEVLDDASYYTVLH